MRSVSSKSLIINYLLLRNAGLAGLPKAPWTGERTELLFDRASRLGLKSHEFNPYPDTRETIAYFATSLDFEVRSGQAKSQVYDGSFGEMCRSVHEDAVRAEVWGAELDFVDIALVGKVEFGDRLETEFSPGWGNENGPGFALFHDSTPSGMASPGERAASEGPTLRGAPQNGQNRCAGAKSCPQRTQPADTEASMGTTR